MKERTTIYLTPALKDQIEKSARAEDRTLSMWVERACRAALQVPLQPQTSTGEV
jgi:predicted transcriptional regulator